MVSDFKFVTLGRTVRIEQLEFSCRLHILPDNSPGLKVIDAGLDYVVLDDESAGIQTRIPIHCVESVMAPDPAPAVEPAVQAA